jgi:hypothetical protein
MQCAELHSASCFGGRLEYMHHWYGGFHKWRGYPKMDGS